MPATKAKRKATRRRAVRTKKQTTSEKIRSSAGVIRGGRERLQQPYSYDEATRHYASWVYKALNINAKARASQPLRLYVRKTSPVAGRSLMWDTRPLAKRAKRWLRGDALAQPSLYVMRKGIEFADDYEEVTEEHPILDTLARPNPAMTGTMLAEMQHLHYQLTGNSFVHPVLNLLTGAPSQFWPMLSHWVEIVPGAAESGEWIKGYWYGGRRSRIFFEAEEAKHWRDINPRDLYYGMGKVEAGWSVIQQNVANHNYRTGLFRNFARPDYLFIIKEGQSEESIERFEADIEERFRDSRDAGKFVTVTGDVAIQPMQWAPKDMVKTEEIVEEVAAICDVPITKLKANDPNRANAEQGDFDWVKDVTIPALNGHEEFLNEYILPLWGPEIANNAFLAYDNPLPENRQFDHTTRIEDANAGLRTWNEVRNEQGLESYAPEIGDVPRVNGVSVEDIGQPADPLAGMFQFNHGDAFAKSQAELRHKAPAEQDVREGEASAVVASMRDVLARIFQQQLAAVLARLGGVKAAKADELTGMVSAVMENTLLVEQQLREDLLRALGFGADHALGELPDEYDPFDVTNPKVVEFVDQYVPRLAGAIQAETLRSLQLTHSTWQRGGGSIADLTQAVRALNETTFGPARSEAIARTESARAFVQGQVEGWEQSGVVTGKRWLLAPGACEFCKQAAKIYNGRRQYGLRETPDQLQQGTILTGTDGGKMKLDYEGVAGPPLHPNDRCDLVPVVE